MSLHNYIEKLRAKPVRERERIAVIATAAGFALIFLIWIVSFKEMNKPAEQAVDPTSASLNDLKNNFQDDKDSIQDMMQQLPSQTGAADMNSDIENSLPGLDENTQNAENSLENNIDQNNPGVPQLP